MLQPFKYEGVGYQHPGSLEYGQRDRQDKQEQEQGNLGQLKGLMEQFQQGGGMNMFSSAGGGEAALAQGGSGSMGPVAELAAAETTAGTSGGGGGGWMSSMFGGGGGGGAGGAGSSGMKAAMSNPWTALAAVVVGNEIYAHKKGYRDKDPVKYAGDLVSGNVFSDDMEQRWLPKLGMKEGSTANKWLTGLSNPVKPIAGWLKDLF